jgi:isopentenyl diphosphate isomerase/L-lactate dehydrogenase-like FMN-dependent dehydrogenase
MQLSQAKYNFSSCEYLLFINRQYLIVVTLRRYVNKDRSITKRIVQHAEARGIKGLFITVDAPQLGRREKAGSNIILHIKFTSFEHLSRICG